MSVESPSISYSSNTLINFLNSRNTAKAIMVSSLVVAIAATTLLTPMAASIAPFAISATVSIKAVAAIAAVIFLIAATILYRTREKTAVVVEANDSELPSPISHSESEEEEDENIEDSNPSSRSPSPTPSAPILTVQISTAMQKWNNAKDKVKTVTESSKKQIAHLEKELIRKNKKEEEEVREKILLDIQKEQQKITAAAQEEANALSALRALQAKKAALSPQR